MTDRDLSDWLVDLQMIQNTAEASGDWPGEFMAQYKPDRWMGVHRAACVFIGSKIRDASVYSVAAPVTPSGAAGEGWINAEERLPQSGQHVLALIWKWDDPTRGRVAVWGCYDSGIWIDLSEDEPYGDAQLHTPTYWLPVPPLPKDESTASGSVSNEAATESTKTTPDAARKSGEAKK